MSKQAAKEGEKRPLPGSYSEMYPNRFMKADGLKGKKMVFTIKEIVGEGLMSEDGGANIEWVVTFEETRLQFVMNKTNAYCLYRMFGGDPHSWIGHKIVVFPATVMAFGAKQDCIRIWGSPELPEDTPITVPQGRKKKLEMVMHKVTLKANGAAPEPPAAPAAKPSREGLDPRILTGLGIIGEPDAEAFLIAHENDSQAQLLAALNAHIDARL